MKPWPMILSLSVCLSALGASEPQATRWTPLRKLAEQHVVQLGTAIKYQAFLEDPTYRATLVREYQVVTPENALKWAAVRPGPKTFDFARADALIRFAETNGLMIRGHTLCWNLDRHLPKWILEGTFTRPQAEELLRQHIQTVVGRYRGRIACWDVVNEAIANDPRRPALAEGFWLRTLGPDYIEAAFRWAHQADPEALLFYNDYDRGESMGPKADRIYDLVRNLVNRQVPLHGVGLQMHCSIVDPPREAEVEANLRRFTDLGLQVHITELDVAIEESSGSLVERLERQADVYAAVARASVRNPQCTALVSWGFADRWGNTARNRRLGKPRDAPTYLLPFDINYQPKPAALALAEVLRTAPPIHSHATSSP